MTYLIPTLVPLSLLAIACSTTQDESPESAQDTQDAAVVNVDADKDPSSAHLSVSPKTIRLGETATLSWQVGPDAAYCRMNQGFGAVLHVSEAEVSPTRTMTYTFSCPGGPGPVELTTTLEVEDADPESECGVQGDDVYLADSTTREFREGEVPATMPFPLKTQGASTACALRCNVGWLSATLVDGDTPVSLPATVTNKMTLRIVPLESNLHERREGWCELTTAGGDPRITIVIVPGDS